MLDPITDSDSISGEVSAFDRLPDDILLLIFEKLRDAKSLSLCTAICKRFNSFVPQIHSLLLTIPTCHTTKQSKRNHRLIAFASKCVIRPFRSLLRVIRSKSPFSSSANGCTCCRDSVDDGSCGYYYYSPVHILRNFREIRSLELRLPRQISCVSEVCGGGDGSALKWTAEFGSELQSCVIVGATSIFPIQTNRSRVIRVGGEDEGSGEESRVSENDDLKLRVLWTLSCLIAASARHGMLREAVNAHRSVRSVTVTDEIGQGRLTMNTNQIEEMWRNSLTKKKTKEEDDEKCVLTVDDRTRVPALRMKMWIAPELEVPEEGCVMKGATLVVIRPVERWSTAEQEEEESAGVLELIRKVEKELGQKEERVFAEAANKLVKFKRSYTLEMNSF